MVNAQQIKSGVTKYINSEILPHLSGLPKIGVSTYINLMSDKVPELMIQMRDQPGVSILGIIDEEGNMDLDRLYKAVVPTMMEGEKITIEVPLIGSFDLSKQDIDKLYKYILNS